MANLCSAAWGYKAPHTHRVDLISACWGGEKKKKNPLWLSNVSHPFTVNLVYRRCRVFICEWKWLWRHRALLCPNNNNNTFFFSPFISQSLWLSAKKVKWKYKVVFKAICFMLHASKTQFPFPNVLIYIRRSNSPGGLQRFQQKQMMLIKYWR